MSKLFVALILCVVPAVYAANWAVIVAGSNGFWNYRHQADSCHAYQIVAKNGIPDENIIVLNFDDIAGDSENPVPGKVFNKPTAQGTPGVDVYKGCLQDYTLDEVTAANFLNIITGNATAMKGVGTGKVLQSTSEDNVFINFVDHGAVGLVAFPTGPYLYADQLNDAITYMTQNNMFSKLVFYIEACESGSMFENILPANTNVYATTASNSEESSWGTYCPPDDVVNGVEIGSCLGDLYSVNWMEDCDRQMGVMDETLQQQFVVVKNKTDQSHVCQWGDQSYTTERIGDFEGAAKTVVHNSHSSKITSVVSKKPPSSSSIESRDAKLHTLYYSYLRADKKDVHARIAAAHLLETEIQSRSKSDLLFVRLAEALAPRAFDKVFYGAAKQTCGKCCRQVIDEHEAHCGRMSDYSLKYVKVIQNMCNHVGSAAPIINKINEFC